MVGFRWCEYWTAAAVADAAASRFYTICGSLEQLIWYLFCGYFRSWFSWTRCYTPGCYNDGLTCPAADLSTTTSPVRVCDTLWAGYVYGSRI